MLSGFAAVLALYIADRAHTCVSFLDTISVPINLLGRASELLYLHHLLMIHLHCSYTGAEKDLEVCKLLYCNIIENRCFSLNLDDIFKHSSGQTEIQCPGGGLSDSFPDYSFLFSHFIFVSLSASILLQYKENF